MALQGTDFLDEFEPTVASDELKQRSLSLEVPRTSAILDGQVEEQMAVTSILTNGICHPNRNGCVGTRTIGSWSDTMPMTRYSITESHNS